MGQLGVPLKRMHGLKKPVNTARPGPLGIWAFAARCPRRYSGWLQGNLCTALWPGLDPRLWLPLMKDGPQPAGVGVARWGPITTRAAIRRKMARVSCAERTTTRLRLGASLGYAPLQQTPKMHWISLIENAVRKGLIYSSVLTRRTRPIPSGWAKNPAKILEIVFGVLRHDVLQKAKPSSVARSVTRLAYDLNTIREKTGCGWPLAMEYEYTGKTVVFARRKQPKKWVTYRLPGC